jgi:hypothetical protein
MTLLLVMHIESSLVKDCAAIYACAVVRSLYAVF